MEIHPMVGVTNQKVVQMDARENVQGVASVIGGVVQDLVVNVKVAAFHPWLKLIFKIKLH